MHLSRLLRAALVGVSASSTPCSASPAADNNATAAGCKTDLDCSLLGKCDAASGVCACKPGWAGEACGVANLLPMNVSHGYQNATAASWGGRPLQVCLLAVWRALSVE